MKQKTLLNLWLLLFALIVGSGNAWAQTVTWERVTSIQTLFDGGTFIMGYEDSAKSGVIVPLRSKDCGATTSANGFFNSGTTDGSSKSGTIDMSDLSKVTTSDYEVYITGIKVTENEQQVYKYINIQRNNSSGNFYGATSGGTTSNKARLYTSGSSNETNLKPEWSSETNNQFKLTANVTGSYKYLKYNTGSPRFAFYNSAGEKIVFYKKVVKYALTYSATNGSIAGLVYNTSTGVASGASVAEGGKVTLTATPSSGYAFAGWSVSGTGSTLSSTSTNPTTFTMGTANATVTATFESSSAVSTPTFSVVEGTYNETKSVELSCATDDATIYYTTNGDDPTTSSTEYTGTAIAVNATTTIKAFAVKDGLDDSDIASATYTLKCVTPAISLDAGAVYYGTETSISCSTDGAAIHYTTDSSTPTSSSTTYSSSIAITSAQTIKAIAVKDGWDDSDVASAAYTIKAPDAPTFSLDAGLVSKGSSLTLTTSAGANIRYTTDGSTTPTASVGTVYDGAITLNAAQTIKAIAYDGGGNTSSVVSKAYTVFVGDIVTFDASSDTGTSLSKNGVSFSTSATESSVYKFYKSSSTTFSVTNGIIKQIEFTGVSGYAISNMTASAGSLATDGNNGVWTGSASSVTFTASKAQTRATKIKVYVARTAAPTFSVDAGEYSEAKSITISCATDDADIYYTTDGSTPTSSSTEYTGSISITETTTLKAIAIYDDVESPVASATYTMNRPAAPEFDVEEGYFDAAFDLHLSTETDGATIYYTTDGSTPTNESSEYSTKVAISAATTTVKAIAVKNGLTSDVSSVTYTYDTRPAPTFTLSDTEMTILVLSDDETITLTTNSDGAVTFTSSDDEKLDVDNSDDSKIGVLTAYKAGDYTITVQTAATSNYLAGEGTVIVHVVKKTTTMSIGTTFEDGKDLKTASEGLIKGTVKYSGSALSPQPTITYSSSDETVATVDEDGIITFLKAGTTTLTATFEGNDEYAECEGTYVLALYDSTPQEIEVTISLNKTSLNTTTPNGKTLTVKNVSVATNNGTSTSDLAAYDTHVRMYKNSNMVVTAPTGYVLTGISFTEPSSDKTWNESPSASVGTYSSKSWTGSANTVTFTFSAGQCRIASITVTLAPSVTLNKYGYATYCSAHPIDFSETEGFTAWRVSEASSDGTISFVKITDTIKEGQGVLLYNKNADGENKTTVTLTVGESDGSTEFTTSQNKLVGTLIPTVVDNDEYYGLSGTKFLKVNAGTVPAGKALLPASVVPDEARELTFLFLDDEVTGIRTIDNGKMAMDKNAVYDLSGRRVQNPKHGLYIVNGKKVIIK